LGGSGFFQPNGFPALQGKPKNGGVTTSPNKWNTVVFINYLCAIEAGDGVFTPAF